MDGENSSNVENSEAARVIAAETEPEREMREARDATYIVVAVNSRCKRLHKVKGGCWMGREMVFKSSEEFMEMPDKSRFTHVCKVCWPKSFARLQGVLAKIF